MTGKSRLLSRIHQRFEVVNEVLHIAALPVPFTRVKNPDAVLDRVAEEGGTALPYWAELWESSLAVAEYLVKSSVIRRQSTVSANALPTVLDLGCGMGLAGIVAARLGANVLLADIETEALLFARLNSIDMSDRVRVRKVDWQRDDLGEKFDLILGADVVYDRSQWEFLEKFWRIHLRPGGGVIVGEPGRQTGEEFIEWIKARGWRLISEKIPVRTKKINLLRMTRSQ